MFHEGTMTLLGYNKGLILESLPYWKESYIKKPQGSSSGVKLDYVGVFCLTGHFVTRLFCLFHVCSASTPEKCSLTTWGEIPSVFWISNSPQINSIITYDPNDLNNQIKMRVELAMLVQHMKPLPMAPSSYLSTGSSPSSMHPERQ